MSARTIQTKEIKGLLPADDIIMRNNLKYVTIKDSSILQDEDIPAWGNIRDAVIDTVPTPIIRELKVNQTIPYSFSLPTNFDGKYQMSVMIDRGGGIWENYPNALKQDLLDVITDGDGNIIDYFVNRIDLYGTPNGNVNSDHLIFTFSKA